MTQLFECLEVIPSGQLPVSCTLISSPEAHCYLPVFCSNCTLSLARTIRPNSAVRSIYKASGCSDNPNHHVNYLEHVVVRITITHPRRGDLAIYLTSPSGTRSQLLANRYSEDFSLSGWEPELYLLFFKVDRSNSSLFLYWEPTEWPLDAVLS